jgi:GMP synthase-like glutamine amidotransferase
MNILLVNNATKYLRNIKASLKDHKVHTVKYTHIPKDLSMFDAIILSGGYRFNVIDHEKDYTKELRLIRTTNKPIFGICLGFELICYAYHEKLEKLRAKENGIIRLKILKKDNIFKNVKNIRVFENHRWRVRKVKNLVELASSKDGIEIVKHKSKRIYGVQFHPEKFHNKTQGYNILKNFIDITGNQA